MLEDNGTCKSLCVSTIPAEDAKFINDRIREDYALNWLIDGLPAAEMKIDVKSGDMFFDMGFNLGNDDGPNAERPQLYNHYDIVLRYDATHHNSTSWPTLRNPDITLLVPGSTVLSASLCGPRGTYRAFNH